MNITEETNNIKKCTRCGIIKHLEDFTTNNKYKDNKSHICKACAADYYHNKQKDYQEANKDRNAERKAKWYQDNKERISAKRKEYNNKRKDK